MLARYVGRRLLQAVFVLWLIVTLAFVALELTPGDPAQVLLSASGATAEEVAALRVQMGLDDPLLVRYIRYISELLQGDLGKSWLHGRSVGRMILEKFPATLELALISMVVGIVIGLGLGILASVRRGTWMDTVATTIAVMGFSLPSYWTGLLAILFFSLRLGWFPAIGEGDWQHLVLPSLVLGFSLSGSIARMVRARVVEVMEEQFVLAARSRGIPAWRTFFVYALRPALPAVLTIVATQFGYLLDGAVVTETVFTRRGLGKLAMQAIYSQDMPVIRGIVVLGALAHVLANLLADIAQAWLDPRVRETLA